METSEPIDWTTPEEATVVASTPVEAASEPEADTDSQVVADAPDDQKMDMAAEDPPELPSAPPTEATKERNDSPPAKASKKADDNEEEILVCRITRQPRGAFSGLMNCESVDDSPKRMSLLRYLTNTAVVTDRSVQQLQDQMQDPQYRADVDELLAHLRLVTADTLPAAVRNRSINCQGITAFGACSQPAYRGFLGVSVQVHYYCRHRIRLRYPEMPCVGHKVARSSLVDYFPIELLDVLL